MHDQIVLLFDLGGVLVKSSGQEALRRLLPEVDQGEILARWQASESVGLFERGLQMLDRPSMFASLRIFAVT